MDTLHKIIKEQEEEEEGEEEEDHPKMYMLDPEGAEVMISESELKEEVYRLHHVNDKYNVIFLKFVK